MNRYVPIISMALVLTVSGCVQGGETELGGGAPGKHTVAEDCMKLCASYGSDLSAGPCLSDGNEDWKHDDWVCDVAHSPREAIDNLPENQCEDFREGRASHFVEVSPDCEFIRKI